MRGSMSAMLAGIIMSIMHAPINAASMKLRASAVPAPAPAPALMSPAQVSSSPAQVQAESDFALTIKSDAPMAPQPQPASPMDVQGTVPLQPQPKSGDLVHRVKEQLAGDHRTLGTVSAALMSVQTEVDKTEQSMLGKVLDLQTARSFFTRHEEIDTANDKMADDISKLNGQVEGLSSELSKTQREFLSNAHKYRTAERKLKDEVVENSAFIGSMNAELAKEDEVEKELKRLSKIHKELMAEAANVTIAGNRANKMLGEARDKSRNEVYKHKSLRDQLVKMNNYSIKCHASVEKQTHKLGVAMISQSKDSEAVALTMRQKKKANDATEQRLLAEHALLISEVKRTEKESLQEMHRLQDLREDMAELEKNIVEEVRKLELQIKEQKERVKTLSVDLMENAQAEQEHNEKKEAMELHLAELVKEVHESENPVLIATTEAQNEALEAELNEAYELWRSIKSAETTSLLNVDQASATNAAAKESLKLAEDAVQAAHEEGEKKVAQAVKEALASKKKSQAIIDKAEAALAKRCKPDWDAIWDKKRSKLEQCKANKEELSLEQAKKESLMQILKAQSEA